MAAQETIASLPEVTHVVQQKGINTTEDCTQVSFNVDAGTTLRNAASLSIRTFPERDGSRVLNVELLNCKVEAKNELELAYELFFDSTMRRCNEWMADVDVEIAELNRLLLLSDNEIDQRGNNGPPFNQRNQGIWHVLKPNPPFPIHPTYEHHPEPEARMEYQEAANTAQDIQQAQDRDRRAQKAWWQINLDLLEEKKRIMEEEKINLERGLRSVKKRALEEPTDLGVGYANYNFLH